jgi:long-chain acyl-CoA synthetase
MNVALWLQRQALRQPEAVGILHGERVLATYAQWYARVQALAAHWQGQGLVPGDRVAIYLHNHPVYLLTMWAAWQAGLIVVPVNRKLHAKELAWIVEHSGAALVCTDDDHLPELKCPAMTPDAIENLTVGALPQAGDPVDRAAGDTAWIFYTSGTTGKPKGVELTHRNLHCMALAYLSDVDRVDPDDAALYAAPMSHGAGMYMIPQVLGGARHLVPVSGGFDEREILSLATSVRQLSFFAAPTMVMRLVQASAAEGHRGEGIKTIVYGGGPMYAEGIRQAVAVMGDRFVQIYGQGECPMTITVLSREAIRRAVHRGDMTELASVGVAQSVVEVRVVDENGATQPAGVVGEIVARGDIVMKGYWQNAEATRTAIRDGWLLTGDMGAMAADGVLTLKDRSKDVIITGGSNVYPREVEEVLLLHPDVLAAAVIGVLDAEWGERIVAFVQPRPGVQVDVATLDALCLDNLARFKRPKLYRFIDAMPVNAYGKVLKTTLREWAVVSEPPAVD